MRRLLRSLLLLSLVTVACRAALAVPSRLRAFRRSLPLSGVVPVPDDTPSRPEEFPMNASQVSAPTEYSAKVDARSVDGFSPSDRSTGGPSVKKSVAKKSTNRTASTKDPSLGKSSAKKSSAKKSSAKKSPAKKLAGPARPGTPRRGGTGRSRTGR
jgi:hypothetical protein